MPLDQVLDSACVSAMFVPRDTRITRRGSTDAITTDASSYLAALHRRHLLERERLDIEFVVGHG